MSQEGDQIVRKPLRVREGSSRTLDQRLSLRFPRLVAANARLIGKLPPGSRVRQAAVWRGVRLAVEAYNRRDLEASVIGCHPDFEYHAAPNWVEAGLLEPCYRGFEGYCKYVAATNEVWGDYVKPVELIDLGDRLVLLADVPMRAQGSDIPLTEAWGLVSTLKDGWVIRQQEFYDHAEALAAVGLSE